MKTNSHTPETAHSRTAAPLLLLATFNGAVHLEDLLESIAGQTIGVKIVVRDDRSTDNTPEILRRHDQQIRILEDNCGNVGVLENFNLLAQAATDAPYLAFADQDDIWEPDKLAAEMDLMLQMEKQFGATTPILVHSDLAVCDSKARVLDSSFWHYQGLNPNLQGFSRLLVQNNITGCTVLINNALKDLAFPVPHEAIMHDWWLALVASAAGKIGFVSRPLVQYRQHEGNQLGAVRKSLFGALQRLQNDPRISLYATQCQAQAFCERFAGKSDMTQALQSARAYAHIRNQNYPRRLWTLHTYGFWKQNLPCNIGLVFFI